jgi:hypothetical protein
MSDEDSELNSLEEEPDDLQSWILSEISLWFYHHYSSVLQDFSNVFNELRELTVPSIFLALTCLFISVVSIVTKLKK